ncbi:hypothetical protein AB6A40_011208 [Gnathostoma spinigerum]|uniref:Uncharacterized protein n=1 Tax=Gnathostoma spinigerum TaxID=75299 RepID=A0ABD6F302_9BILA
MERLEKNRMIRRFQLINELICRFCESLFIVPANSEQNRTNFICLLVIRKTDSSTHVDEKFIMSSDTIPFHPVRIESQTPKDYLL